MNTPDKTNGASRGDIWFDLLAGDFVQRTGQCPSVRVADGTLHGEPVRAIAVVPDPGNHYPRAVRGEVGLLEGWTLGKTVAEAVEQDRGKSVKRTILAIIDVPSQAYGRREEAFGIHLALAAAAGAYATARLAGHPVIGLIVGKAMSGAMNGFRVIFFLMTFFSIGMVSNFRKLMEEGIGRLAIVYIVCLFGFIIWVGLFISYAFFHGMTPPVVGA